MKNLYENAQIEQLLKDFYTVTGQRVGVFDRDANIIVEYPQPCCDFCSHIRSFQKGYKACMNCDRTWIKEAAKGKTVKYRCHAGLIEICAPIVDEIGIIGYFMFGQVLYDTSYQEQYEQCKKLCADYFTPEEFEQKISSVKRISAEYLHSVENIMAACVGFIYLKQLMNVSGAGLWGQIDYYLERNYTRHFTLEEMAEELKVSVSSICKTSKAKTGRTLKELLMQKRIHKAKKLLQSSSHSISEIALLVGITDYNYFSRLFKRMEGVSPTAFRKLSNERYR